MKDIVKKVYCNFYTIPFAPSLIKKREHSDQLKNIITLIQIRSSNFPNVIQGIAVLAFEGSADTFYAKYKAYHPYLLVARNHGGVVRHDQTKILDVYAY